LPWWAVAAAGRCVASAVLLVGVLAYSGLAPVAHGAGIPDHRFGVVEAYENPAAASVLGAGWERITFRWSEIQPNGPDEWTLGSITDAALGGELARGREVVGLLITTPEWATDVGRGAGVPQGLYLSIDDPNNHWANFVRTIVGQYANRIDHWIIWNEPDIPSSQHMSWGGSIPDFVQLMRVSYLVAKQTNPQAVVHLAAVTHWWDEHWFGRYLDALVADAEAAGNSYYFDVASLHIYFQPETVYDITAHYYREMHNRGIAKPIWIVETNAAPSQDPAWPVPDAQFSVTLDQQASYMLQTMALGIAAGAQRIGVFKMADTEADRSANPEPFGLVRKDGSRRPAFTAYQVATNYLSGFRGGRWDRRDEVCVVAVDRGERTTTAVWSRTDQPQTIMLAARTTRALLVDERGSARNIYPERGYYYVDVPGADCTKGCQIGGGTRLVVEYAPFETGTNPQPATPTPIPTASGGTQEQDDSVATTPSPSATLDLARIETRAPTATRTPIELGGGSPTASPTLRAVRTRTPTPSPTATRTATATKPPAMQPSATRTLPVEDSGTVAAPTGDGQVSVPLNREAWALLGVLGTVLVGGAVARRLRAPGGKGTE
jgi:hypothetical protein